jgi:hypothetical protein
MARLPKSKQSILNAPTAGEARYIKTKENMALSIPLNPRMIEYWMTRAVDLKIEQHESVRTAMQSVPRNAFLLYASPYDHVLGYNGQNILGKIWMNRLSLTTQVE